MFNFWLQDFKTYLFIFANLMKKAFKALKVLY